VAPGRPVDDPGWTKDWQELRARKVWSKVFLVDAARESYFTKKFSGDIPGHNDRVTFSLISELDQ